jgi:hypothetical protein
MLTTLEVTQRLSVLCLKRCSIACNFGRSCLTKILWYEHTKLGESIAACQDPSGSSVPTSSHRLASQEHTEYRHLIPRSSKSGLKAHYLPNLPRLRLLLSLRYSPNKQSDRSPQRNSVVDIYAHTEYKQARRQIKGTFLATKVVDTNDTTFKRAYDIYSLGIVLVEIALWQPIRVFYDRESSASQFHKSFLEATEAKLGHCVGCYAK